MSEFGDPEEESQEEAPRPKPPSMAFSWATLGFILGALFVLAAPWHHPEPPPPETPSAPPPAPPAERVSPPELTTIEAVFDKYQKYAVWDEDTTQVVLFDPQTKSFSDPYEVLRSGGAYYFRSIPELTRPLLTHGVPEDCPLEFTETEEQREEWIRAVNDENWKAIRQSIQQPHP